MTRIAVAGGTSDLVVQAIVPALEAAGAEAVVADSVSEGAPSLSIADGRLFLGGEPLDDVGAWFARAIVLPLPMIFFGGPVRPEDSARPVRPEDSARPVRPEDSAGPARPEPVEGRTGPDFAHWWAEHQRILGRQSLYLGVLAAQAERGIPVINPLRMGSPEVLKARDLHVMARAGVPLPRTLVTSSPREAERFLAAVGDAIVKPLQGRHAALPVTPEVRARLRWIRSAPAIFQERVRGDDIRVTIVGDEVVSALRVESGQSETMLDFRATEPYLRGEARYERVRLPAAVRRACLLATRALGYELTGIDLKLGARGRFALLEANASPLYVELERKGGDPISARLAEHLVRRARAAGKARGRRRSRRDTTAAAVAPGSLPRSSAPIEPYGGYFFDYMPPFR